MKTTWQTLMREHNALRSDGVARLYDRVSILLKIKDDPKFLAHCKKHSKTADEVLNEAVNDTCCHWVDLVAMRKLKPNREQWTFDLKAMQQELLTDIRKQQPGVKTRIAAQAKVEKVTAQAEQLRQEAQKVKGSEKKKLLAEAAAKVEEAKALEKQAAQPTNGRKHRTCVTVAEGAEKDAEIARLTGELEKATRIIVALEEKITLLREALGAKDEALAILKMSRGPGRPKKVTALTV